MATESPEDGGIMLDTSLIFRSIRYYSIIGGGLGLLGVVLLLQLGGGDGPGGVLIGALLFTIVLSFAVLSGPIIAAIIGYATAQSGIGDIRTRSVNSGIANGVGFVVFGIVVTFILWAGMALLFGGGSDAGASSTGGGSSGPIEIGKLVTLLVLMMIPNSLVGGLVTYFLEGRGGASPQ